MFKTSAYVIIIDHFASQLSVAEFHPEIFHTFFAHVVWHWYLDITPGEYAVHRTIQREELEYHDFLADVEGAILFRCSNVWKKIRCGNTLYNGRSEFPKHSDRKNPDETLNVTRISQ
uniref:Uncharacterized protein n=1 Tax=Rhipicephalus zambeziensis TaxID=60191 RepID=A0A224YAJ1_9ACAR